MLTARWTPVYIEPLPYSGERLCAAIAFETDSDGARVISTLPTTALDALFSHDAAAMGRLTQQITASLDRHLATHPNLSNWLPPFDGVEKGETKCALEAGWDQLIASITTNVACLASVKAEQKPHEEPLTQAWYNSVRHEVVERDQRLRMNFDVPVAFERGSLFKLGFVGNALAAEFAVINASTPWHSQLTTFMRKLARLVQARKHGGLFSRSHHEVLTRIPGVMTAEETERFGNHKIDAERLADSMEIVFKTYTRPEQAASHIIKLESH